MIKKNNRFPNIIFIVMDTTRAQNISCYGYDKTTTPFLDQFAGNSLLYQNAISVAPWTLPVHASFFTGTFPVKHRTYAYAAGANWGGGNVLPAKFKTLAELLQKLGYETAGFSSNTFLSESFGLSKGFERFFITWQIFQTQADLAYIEAKLADCQGLEKIRRYARELIKGSLFKNLLNGVYGRYFQFAWDYGARRINNHIKSWYSRLRDPERPFFLFINYMEPHLKYCPPRAFRKLFLPHDMSKSEAKNVNQDPLIFLSGKIEMGQRDFSILESLYNAEVRYLDYKMKEIFDFLESELDHSVVIVTSDHGENIGEHGLMSHFYGLQETLIHIPLIIKLPGLSEGKKEVSKIVQPVDIFPTILGILGHEDEEVRPQFQGFNLLSSDKRQVAVAELLAPVPPMEFLSKRVGTASDLLRSKYNYRLRAFRDHRFKYVWASNGQEELYDLVTDPGESSNLAGTEEKTLSEFRQYREAWESKHRKDEEETSLTELDQDVLKRLKGLGYL